MKYIETRDKILILQDELRHLSNNYPKEQLEPLEKRLEELEKQYLTEQTQRNR